MKSNKKDPEKVVFYRAEGCENASDPTAPQATGQGNFTSPTVPTVSDNIPPVPETPPSEELEAKIREMAREKAGRIPPEILIEGILKDNKDKALDPARIRVIVDEEASSRLQPQAFTLPGYKIHRRDDLKARVKRIQPGPVPGIIPAKSLVVLFGASSAGKTFTALDLAHCVYAGIRWEAAGGRDVTKGNAVYVCAEYGDDFIKRTLAWEEAHPGVDADLPFVFSQPDLLSRDGLEKLITTLQSLDPAPSLVILDSLIDCFGDGSEVGDDMRRFAMSCKKIIREVGASVLLIHHTNARGTEKGNLRLRDAADVMIKLEKVRHLGASQVRHRCGIVSCEKMREAVPFKGFGLSIIPVTLEDGGTSCVIGPVKKDDIQVRHPGAASEIYEVVRHRCDMVPNAGYSTAELKTLTGRDRRTVQRSITSLEEDGKVKNIGTTQSPIWVTTDNNSEGAS